MFHFFAFSQLLSSTLMIEEAVAKPFVAVFSEYVILRSGPTSVAGFSRGTYGVENGSDFKGLVCFILKLFVVLSCISHLD